MTPMNLTYKDHLSLMTDYNGWMNAKLMALLTPLPADTLLEDKGAFFGSVLGTLNHILVADLIWLGRLPLNATQTATLNSMPGPAALDQLVFDTMADYNVARTRLDHLFKMYINGLSEADLAAPLTYKRVNGDAHTKTLGLVLSHVFNHQTHHRGQLTTLLNQMGLQLDTTDLLGRIPDITASGAP
ncbi:MAG: DinB family protein [Asticcacaulis sp.]